MKPLYVEDVIDARPFGPFQWLLFAICFLIALMDGASIQVMGLSAPTMAHSLGLGPEQLGPVFAASEIGFMAGALFFGPLADRFGRKSVLVLCTLLFGVASLCTAAATGFGMLLALRVLTGIGLGGAAPCFVSLATEFVAQRLRARVASLLWAAVPAGGVLAGFAGSRLIPAFGWQAMFQAFGAVTIAGALLVCLCVPESLRFLILAGRQGAATQRILARLGVDPRQRGATLRMREAVPQGMPASHLFTGGRARFTGFLWLGFFLNFMTLIGVLAWTTTLLRGHGMSLPDTSLVLAWNNVGGMAGVALAGKLMERFGTFRFLAMLLASGSVAVALTGLAGAQLAFAAACSMLTGFCVGGATSGMIGLAALGYPTAIRSTGVGCGLAAGRLGGATGPLLVGALVGAGMDTTQTFALIAMPSLLAAFAVLAMRRAGGAPAPATAGAR